MNLLLEKQFYPGNYLRRLDTLAQPVYTRNPDVDSEALGGSTIVSAMLGAKKGSSASTVRLL